MCAFVCVRVRECESVHVCVCERERECGSIHLRVCVCVGSAAAAQWIRCLVLVPLLVLELCVCACVCVHVCVQLLLRKGGVA